MSTVVGGKANKVLEGYSIRHLLWERQNEIKISKDFYLSSAYKYSNGDYNNSLILGSNKSVMFDNEYHIAIENTMMRNMFSEKLIDCFQTKTIPIYYGCPNIGDYFNSDGILSVESVDDIINICNGLIPEIYKDKLEAIEDNYQRSMDYVSHTEILDKKLDEVLNK